MEITQHVKKMDALIEKGDFVSAARIFIEQKATKLNAKDGNASNKEDLIIQIKDFLSDLDKIDIILHHRTLVDSFTTISEFTFGFRKDGKKIRRHLLILRVWNLDGRVIQENYFQKTSAYCN